MPDPTHPTPAPAPTGGTPTVPTVPTVPAVPTAPTAPTAPTGNGGAPATTDPASPAVKVLFGVAFRINGKPVVISTDDVADLRRKGIEFELPGRVDLGTIDDARTFLQTNYHVSTDFLNDLPEPLNGVVHRLTTLNFAVERFHLKIAGTDHPAPTRYTLAMSAMWTDEGIQIVQDTLAVQGVMFGISNEPQPGAAGAATPVPGEPATKTLPPGGAPETNAPTGGSTSPTTSPTTPTDHTPAG